MRRAVSAVGKRIVSRAAGRVARTFEQQLTDCRQTQRETLQRLLALNRGTRFQADHRLSPGLSLETFRNSVPLQTYEDLAQYIDDVVNGDEQALCGAENRPLMFALTSGTSGSSKHIPVTRRFVDDYRRSWQIWGYHAFETHGEVPYSRFLQLVSNYDRYRTASDLPCGNISGLLQTMQNPFVRWKFVVPTCVQGVSDPTSKLYLVLRLALTERNVGFITAANPSTLIHLAQQAEARRDELIRDIHDGRLAEHCFVPDNVRRRLRRRLTRKNPGRARELSRIAERSDRFRPADYWEASLIAVWTGGSAGAYLPAVRDWYGDLPIRDHGLLASEGRMTIPIADGTSAGILDITSHFFEFIPEAAGDDVQPVTLLAHELEAGKSYFIVLTTASGLYRYNIFDVVRCTGFLGTTPLLEFRHKGAHISNITGEKLTESQVVAAVSEACRQTGLSLGHYTVAPVWGDPPGYRLLIEEGDVPHPRLGERLVSAIEQALLRENCEYQEKRETGRLSPLEFDLLPPDTWTAYIHQRQSRPGASAEQYKHPCLKPDLSFADDIARIATQVDARRRRAG